jgi:hypothetical protein
MLSPLLKSGTITILSFGGKHMTSLVILAAGMGSRYGGLKQMEAFGQSGEVILDYSVYDAIKAGFSKVIFIIKKSLYDDFKKNIVQRMEKTIDCAIVYQDLDSLIPPDIFSKTEKKGRVKPWGTAHALLCAEKEINSSFLIINSDDFYGREAFMEMGKFLSSPFATMGALVAYRLSTTVSASGPVSRGVCSVKDGFLSSIDEQKNIEMKGKSIISSFPDGSAIKLSPDTPVSMNFWGFSPDILSYYNEYFKEFLATQTQDITAECYLPKGVDHFIKQSGLQFNVLYADSEWFGVTYKEDKATTKQNIDRLVQQGRYPANLWA